MYIERDKEFELLYISLGDGSQEGNVAQTREVLPGVLFDLDVEGKLLGIEIANTKEVLGIPVAALRLSGELLGVKEAAELTGKDRGNFIRDLARKPDFPEPVAQLASGQVWLSKDIEKYIEKSASHRDNQEQDSGSPAEGTSRIHEGDYVYEGGGEGDASSETTDDAGFYPNRGTPDHEPYSSGSYDQYRGETA